jgi:hypothetical protein
MPKKAPDGARFLTVELKHGHHRYAFLVDGVLTLDPQAQGITRNEKGERVSLLAGQLKRRHCGQQTKRATSCETSRPPVGLSGLGQTSAQQSPRAEPQNRRAAKHPHDPRTKMRAR